MALINLRNALMAGKRLPYDAEVEYLESTGTQWIEVPMVVDSSATVNITGYVGATNKELFSFDKLGTKQFNIETSATFYRWWTSERINVGSGYVGALHSYKCNSSIWVDGVLKGTSTPTDTSTTQTFYILNGYHNAASGRIYHVSVEYGGRLIFDGIPVRKGTVGYLYDRVSGALFGNAGTGDFVLGPDVVPVEWLESDGYSYIQTDILPSADLRTKIRAAYTSTPIPQNSSLFGSRSTSSSNDRYWVNYDGHFEVGYGGYSATTIVVSPNELIDIDFNYIENGDHKFKFGNTAVTVDGTPNTTVKIPIFGRSIGGVLNRQRIKCCYADFIRDGVDVGKFLPVRVGTDATSWEGAMMDVLTRRIYRNQGTGAFSYGADLPLETLAN